MHGDPLAQGFVDRLAQGIVQVRFPAQDERKAVQGVIAVVHEHLNVLQDACGEVLGLVNGQKKGLLLFPVKVEDLLLYGPEHPGFAASRLYSQYRAELAVELHDAYGGKTDVLHMVKVRVEPLCKTAESKRLPHARACREQTNAPGILEVIQPGEHLRDVPGKETVFFPGHLFVKRIERQSIVRTEHQQPPPNFE